MGGWVEGISAVGRPNFLTSHQTSDVSNLVIALLKPLYISVSVCACMRAKVLAHAHVLMWLSMRYCILM